MTNKLIICSTRIVVGIILLILLFFYAQNSKILENQNDFKEIL